ncbi:hypothetical protein FMN63_24920 [Stappia sp. BW2]|uniref:hypothetical protein n=1 Tax=Stappia sp. BW2 TaxID=2592622 RepID=UPI0011DE80C4|nr:hypothetical protein [Stappia sp. BW2]TYC65629.1 hypothetical protein FMN63_24920 [Stappia sp. BW2]
MTVTRFLSQHYLLREAAKDGVVLQVTCQCCWKRANYLATDLARLLGGDRPVVWPPFDCSGCGNDRYVKVKVHHPEPGDYGSMRIRRPGPVKMIQTWQVVSLGD